MGEIRPIEHMQGVWGHRNAFMFNERVFIPKRPGQLDEEGKIKEGSPDLMLSQTKNFCALFQI